MIIDNNIWNSPVRRINTMVELLNGSTVVSTYTPQDALKSFKIERVGEEGKFFGFGVCQKINVHLIDVGRFINISTANSFKTYLSSSASLNAYFPTFYVTETHRDENTNELSVTAYDRLYAASSHTVEELNLLPPYTIMDVAEACSKLLGTSGVEVLGLTEDVSPFDTEYPEGANVEGTEKVRDILNAIAEVTQTVYYINRDDKLIFKRPDNKGEAVFTITQEDYFTLESKTNRRLSDICSTTELGDNITTTSGISGTTQYIRDNPFWELREDILTLLENALAAVSGLTINQFNCSWRGNPSIEIADKIGLVAKDGSTHKSFIFNDSITYNGGLSEQSMWAYGEADNETESNPATLGEAIKKTFAQVDKANQEIRMVAGEVAKLTLNTDGIIASVEELEKKVEATITPEEVQIAIQEQLAEGVTSVTTTTGFTFNADGLTVSKTDSETSTQITDDGLTINSNVNGDTLLIVNKDGVEAKNLHATTFLIIGDNSRLEDYEYNGEARTGCFWIG